jgi:hypothetical protein
MTTVPVLSRAGAPAAATAQDLTDRQVIVLIAVAVVVFLAAIIALAAYGGAGIVAPSTSFSDLTAAATGTLI